MSLRRESRRLSRAFGALVLALTPAAAAQACSDASSGAADALDAAADERGAESPAAADAALEGAADSSAGAVHDPCNIVGEILEGGPDAPADADFGCRYTLPCGLPEASAYVLKGCDFYATEVPDGGDASLGCWIPESEGCSSGAYTPPASGVLVFQCADCFGGGGRRPAGLRRPRVARAPSAVGGWFAQMAHDEAASIHAFARMHEELERLGAPRELTDAAERSARDEARHARSMACRARAFGARVPAARVRRGAPRTLEAVARENAVEGCVLETFGALLMRWQAAHARDASLQRLFARIAADETRHAALSWELARWADDNLDSRARARVRAARARAVRSLRARVGASSFAAWSPFLGQPRREEALALVDGMIASLDLA
jgi:hypothetical protein